MMRFLSAVHCCRSDVDDNKRCMDLSEPRIFGAVVREGGITRAAERLHRVQSNVTTRIGQIEDDSERRCSSAKANACI